MDLLKSLFIIAPEPNCGHADKGGMQRGPLSDSGVCPEIVRMDKGSRSPAAKQAAEPLRRRQRRYLTKQAGAELL